MSKDLCKEYLKLHISIMLAGLTGILGKLITMNAVLLVWYRMFLSFVMFYILLFFFKKLPKENFIEAIKISLLGMLLALHFLFFFASIKYANVAIGVVCYSLEGFFTALLEPVILKKSFSIDDILYSLLAVAGISLIFHVDTHFRFGIMLGIVSAALIALYTILNKVIGINKSSKSMLFYELFGGTFFLSVVVIIFIFSGRMNFEFPSLMNLSYLFVLTFFCAIGLYILQIQALRTLSAFTVSLCANLEPVYGILLAVLFLGEGQELSLSFYIGMTLIFLSVFVQSVFNKTGLYENILKLLCKFGIIRNN